MTRPHIDESLARRLVDAQFPQWAELPLRRLDPAGSDHVIYRLGDELSVRLPRHPGAIGQAEAELEWLPRLAPHLPLAVPVPVAVGEPGFGYPWRWAVSRWLDGTVATVEDLAESPAAARQLAGFLTALQAIPTTGAPARKDSLAGRDDETREAIAAVADDFDAAALLRVWEAALAAPAWDRDPVWVHGDFHTGNLLTTGGRLTAVIDFGGTGAGDPAADLMVAFSLLSPPTRELFRSALAVDDATWARGRGWALTGAVVAHQAYAATEPRVAAQTRRQLSAVLG